MIKKESEMEEVKKKEKKKEATMCSDNADIWVLPAFCVGKSTKILMVHVFLWLQMSFYTGSRVNLPTQQASWTPHPGCSTSWKHMYAVDTSERNTRTAVVPAKPGGSLSPGCSKLSSTADPLTFREWEAPEAYSSASTSCDWCSVLSFKILQRETQREKWNE